MSDETRKTAREVAHEALEENTPVLCDASVLGVGHTRRCDALAAAIEARDAEHEARYNTVRDANDLLCGDHAKLMAALAEAAKWEAHATEGWGLANHRTRQWKAAEAEAARYRGALDHVVRMCRAKNAYADACYSIAEYTNGILRTTPSPTTGGAPATREEFARELEQCAFLMEQEEKPGAKHWRAAARWLRDGAVTVASPPAVPGEAGKLETCPTCGEHVPITSSGAAHRRLHPQTPAMEPGQRCPSLPTRDPVAEVLAVECPRHGSGYCHTHDRHGYFCAGRIRAALTERTPR